MALGRRQNYAAKQIAADATATFTVDRRFLVSRICFYPTDGTINAGIDAEKFSIQAEGENLWSGLSLPLAAFARKTDHAVGQGTAQGGPWVWTPVTPLELSKDFPLELKHDGAENWTIVLEGPQGGRN